MTESLVTRDLVDGSLDVSRLINDPIMVATSNSYRRLLTQSGKPVCLPCNQRSDNHPDLDASDEVLQLMAAAPELYDATHMLVKAVESLSAHKPVRNLDEIMLFALAALNKAGRQI